MNIPILTDLAGVVIACLALLVSVIGGLLNYWYTRKTFETTAYPVVAINLITSRGEHGGSSFVVALRNLSTNVAVEDASASLMIADPLRRWYFWRKKWHALSVEKGKRNDPRESWSISPEEEEYIELSPGYRNTKIIEDFLQKYCSSVIRQVNIEGYNDPFDDLSYFRDHPLMLRIVVKYRPAVYKANLLRQERVYILRPRKNTHIRSDGIDGGWEALPVA